MGHKTFWGLIVLLATLFSSCQCRYNDIDPCISCTPPTRCIASLPGPFSPLSSQEKVQEWGREHTIASAFAKDLDLYRAVTTYKRALILSPPANRRLEIEYSIVLCYFLSKKYCEVINNVENSELIDITDNFPAYRDLLVILYECYETMGLHDRACRVLSLLESVDAEAAEVLPLSTAMRQGNIGEIRHLATDHRNQASVDDLLSCYCQCRKDPCTAQTLSAILPGAGYYYVGQCQSAITSFVINGLFIWAAARFFDQGHVAAGIITTSLEAGWYFGGIHGAALAAKEYNERLYEGCAKETMLANRFFPVLMLRKGF